MRRPDTVPPDTPGLRAFVDDLGLPQPERARVLEEIAADLEQMRTELVRRGMDPADADREAMRLLAPSEAAISALASVHEPLYATLARRFSSGMRWAEWAGLVTVTLVALGLGLAALARAGVLDGPSPFLLPVLGVSLVVCALAGRKATQFWIARDHRADRLHAGMPAILIASGMAVLVSFIGAVVDLMRLAASLEATPGRTRALVRPWLLDTSVLLYAGLATALAGGLAWFLLRQKIAAVEGADLRAVRAIRRATSPVTLPLERSLSSTGAPR